MENLIQNILSICLGIMIFFSFVLAPMIFKILDAENAGKFVRKIFPYYYSVNLVFLLITIILFIALLVLAFYWNFKQDQQRQKDVKESGNDLRELDKRRKNIGLNLNYKLFVYIFLAIVVINVFSRQC